MSGVSFNYLRALQLEGRHPADVGAWPITYARVHAGEGRIDRSDPRHIVKVSHHNFLPDLPQINNEGRQYIAYYRRLDSIDSVKGYISENREQIKLGGPGLLVSLPIFPEWVSATSGRIPLIDHASKDSILSHCIMVKDCDQNSQEFKFLNNWRNWGEESKGYLPFDYFKKYAFDCHALYLFPQYLRRKKQPIKNLGMFQNWTARSTSDVRVYGFEFMEKSGTRWQRIAWCFMSDTGKNFLIEDFYVRPEFRGKGYGREIAGQVRDFVLSRGKAVNYPVPFADCRSESPNTYEALVATVKHLGLVFSKSDSHFAAYLAHSPQPEKLGSPIPIEPDFVPLRPRSSFAQAIAAFGLATGFMPAATELITVPAIAPLQAFKAEQTFPKPGTAAWDEINRRRNELIRKKVKLGLDGLTTDERTEYEWLQKMSLQAVQSKFEYPTPLQRDLEEARRKMLAE